jgi:20S proteasome subunit beta 4
MILVLLLFALFLSSTLASSAAGHETLIGIVGRDFVMLGADSSVSQSIVLQSSTIDKINVVVDPFPSSQQKRHEQQTILAAAAGNAADSDRLVGKLAMHAAVREYEASVGSDVEYIGLEDEHSVSQSTASSSSSSQDCLTVEAVASLARGEIASSLRSRNPLHVCLLIAGMQLLAKNEEEDLPSFSRHLQHQVQHASRNFQETSPTTTITSTTTYTTTTTTTSTTTPDDLWKPRLYWLDSHGALQRLHYGAHGLGANFLLSVLDQNYRDNLDREQAAQLIRDCFHQLRQRFVVNSPQPPCIKCVDMNGCQTY